MLDPGEIVRHLAETIPADTPQLGLVPLPEHDVYVWGFWAAGDEAVNWWRRLAETHTSSGYWPLLLDREAVEIFSMVQPEGDHQTRVAAATALDGGELLTNRCAERLTSHEADWASSIKDELRGEAEWRTDPPRPGYWIPFGAGGSPANVIVALVPATAGWQVPAVLGYDCKNDGPRAAEHSAIIRTWGERFDAQLVSLTGDMAEFAVARPPTTRADALALAWEFSCYSESEYDHYQAESLTDLASSLLNNPVWLAWWD